MKKILFALCLAALVVTGCDPKKKHYIGNETNYGVFQFAQSELVVDVSEDVTSFRLEGSYKVQPDKDAYGDIWLYLDAKQTTAIFGSTWMLNRPRRSTPNTLRGPSM